jgi:hypothetical protein
VNPIREQSGRVSDSRSSMLFSASLPIFPFQELHPSAFKLVGVSVCHMRSPDRSNRFGVGLCLCMVWSISSSV